MAAGTEIERLRIGEVAEQLGTTPRTIRYYEEFGLLEAGGDRPAGGHRTYGPEEIERIRELIRLRELLGVSLDELRALIGAEDARAALRSEYRAGASEARQAEILTESLGHIEGQLELVRKRRTELERFEKDLLARKRRGRELLRKLRSESPAPGKST